MIWSRVLIAVAAGLALQCLASANALAQSAEETVAFAVFGLENGTNWKGSRFEKKSSSPAIYQNDVLIYAITKKSECKYAGKITAVDPASSSTKWISYEFDFSDLQPNPVSIIGDERNGPNGARSSENIEIPGLVWSCSFDNGGTCRSRAQAIQDLGRINKALQFFRSKFCSGKAF